MLTSSAINKNKTCVDFLCVRLIKWIISLLERVFRQVVVTSNNAVQYSNFDLFSTHSWNNPCVIDGCRNSGKGWCKKVKAGPKAALSHYLLL